MLARKHYKAVAEIIASANYTGNDSLSTEINENNERITLTLSDFFKADNPNFDRKKFLKACGFDPEK